MQRVWTTSAAGLLLIVVAVFILGHIPFLSAPYTNVECWTGEAARLSFEGRWLEGVKTYQIAVSSPPFTYFLILPFYAVMGVGEAAARLPTLLSALASIVLVFEAGRRWYSPAVGVLAAALIAFNPLFWTYTNVICCNDLPLTLMTAVTMLAVVEAVRKDTAGSHLVAGLCLGVALLVKFNAAVYAPAVAVVAMHGRLARGERVSIPFLARMTALYAPGLALAGAFYLLVIQATGTLLNPNISPSKVSRAPTHLLLMPPRLAYYLTWFGLLAGPLALIPLRDLWERFGARRLVKALLVLAPVNVTLITLMNFVLDRPGWDLGEMRLGWVEHVLPPLALWTFQFAGLILGEAVAAGLLFWGLQRGGPSASVALWSVTVLIADGLWRGAARYVLYLLPGLALYLADSALRPGAGVVFRRLRTAAVAFTVLWGLAVGVFSTAYFATEGRAAADVASYINQNALEGLEFEVNNPVLAHCAYLVDKRLFAPEGTTPRYVTMTWPRGQRPTGALFVRPVRLLGVEWKTYGVVPWTPAGRAAAVPDFCCAS